MTALEKPFIAPESYLEAERAAEFKSEYVNGEVFAMSGAQFAHNQIASNANGGIREQMKGRPCHVMGSDMKVRVESANAYFYPDLSGRCGEFEFESGKTDIYTNPQFIIEILLESTEPYDRGDKFFHYQTLSSLEEYVLISQTKVAVEVFRKRRVESSGVA